MDPMSQIKETLTSKLVYGYSLSRSALYFLESKPLPYIRKIFDKKNSLVPPSEFQKKSMLKLTELLQEDANNIAQGIYPHSVLSGDSPKEHIKRVFKIWADAFFISYRRSKNKNKKFDKKATKLLEGLPDYYKRNFHNQTNGYLSENSAEIYDHQVDILFNGATDAMRRSILKPLKKYIGKKNNIKILELGCGSGSFTKFLSQTFPEAKITAVDISKPYLNKANEKYKTFENINFISGFAEDLDFKSENFDVVVSVYLFHELPENVRKKIVIEGKRVLKKGGLFGLVDSIQSHDTKELSWALEQFPKVFHEPFYKNYISKPIEDLVQSVFEVEAAKVTKHFMSKCVVIEKSI